MESVVEKAKDDESSAEVRLVEIPDNIGVKKLAELLKVSGIDVIKQLMRNGLMANINQTVSYDQAAAVATGLGYEAKLMTQAGRKSASVISEIKKQQQQNGKDTGNLKPRPPVVTVMGHVDHGKTKLLDAIRQTNVMEGEAGGITQHIGAYQVEVNGRKITFLDTPGHEAFTAMRARGARVTDITVLVVAADDGVMPQTLEAIDHARAAGVPIVVAINKIDKPEANPDLVKQQLAEAGLVVEEWGGNTVAVAVSAKEKTGIPQLLENLLLVADMEELKADPLQPAVGVVIESKLDKAKGALTTVLIHNGTLRVGDTIVVGNAWGKVKAMYNDLGKQVRRVGPASPAEILGLSGVSQSGDTLTAVADERHAKALIEKNQPDTRQASTTGQKAVSLSNLLDRVTAGDVQELSVVLKTDVQGSIEPIRNSLEHLSTDEVKVTVIHASSGNITESDVMLAIASKGIIIAFNATAEPGAQRLAELEGISIRYYNVIYALVDDVSKALKGMLKPVRVEVIDGQAEVRAVFGSGKKTNVAGSYITDGKVTRGVSVRVKRQGKVIVESVVNSLRRFKEDAREVTTGFECGVGVDGFNDFKVGDTLEFFRTVEKD
ncbi:MAG: translation initiation factor IF-2 [Chloroflexi bacterium RBG_16_51_9]|nr:MAG: translation initiation factor IF-2 [Chloroflexi bacterium RBG_16_51_9]